MGNVRRRRQHTTLSQARLTLYRRPLLAVESRSPPLALPSPLAVLLTPES